MEPIFVGLFIFIIGGINVVRPDFMIRLQIWTQGVVMGAKYEPSERTYKAVRIIGVLFILLGLLAMAGAIR